MAVTERLAGVRAVIGVSLREMRRQQLWVLAVVPAVVLMVVVPLLRAVESGDRLRLGVVTTLSSMGFLATLLAILVSAGLLRRDREQQIWAMLFSKPLGHGGYLLGRWLGCVIGLFVAVLIVAIGGTVGTTIAQGRLPAVRAVQSGVEWTTVDRFGQERSLHDRQVTLSGPAGDAVRWRLTGLSSQEGDAEVLVRAQVRHARPGWPLRRARVAVAVYPHGGDPAAARRLVVSPDSPYGQVYDDGRAVVTGEALLTHRGPARDDLASDYLRLVLPAALIAPDLVVAVVRLEDQARLTFERDRGLLVSRPAGGYPASVLAASLIVTAQAGMLAAIAILVASVSNLGVSLLAGLSVFFAGHSLPFIEDVLRRQEFGQIAGRLLALLQLLVPDLQRFRLPLQLAGGHAVDAGQVLVAWGYYGSYAALALLAAWWLIRRGEA